MFPRKCFKSLFGLCSVLALLFFLVLPAHSQLITLNASGSSPIIDKNSLNSAEKKIQTALLILRNSASSLVDQKMTVNKLSAQSARAATAGLSNQFQKIDSSARIQVYIKYTGSKNDLINAISAAGGKVDLVNEKYATVQAWIPYDMIEELAGKDHVKNISFPDYAVTNTGSVTSEGDTIHEADKARNISGWTGAGIKVGVISDGIDGIALSQASGDIPATYEAQSARSDHDLNACPEGLAMMEIVHDLAPAAPLAFSNPGTSLEMLNAIQILDTTLNCKVIVDDLSFFTQPWFEDGTIADQVTTTTAHGKLYVSSAGNNGDKQYYEGDFSGISKSINGTTETVQNFGGAGDGKMRFIVPKQTTAYVFLQWNDHFGASNNDYDLYLTNSLGVPYTSSTNLQNGTQDPFEYASVYNGGVSAEAAYIVVSKNTGAADKRLKILVRQGSGQLDQYYTTTGTIFGHQASDSTYTVGALDRTTPNAIETYSSQGPVRTDYPTLAYHQKPDICGIDDVAATGNGGFLIPFRGTSAAAPHIAAIAALVWSASPSLTNAQVRRRINSGAVDLGAAGYDNIYGYGRADAFNIDLTPPPTPTVDPVSSPTNITSLTLTGTKSADTAEILINDSSSASSYPTATTWTAAITLTKGVNTLKIKARDAAGNDSGEVVLSVTVQDLTITDPATDITVIFPVGSITTTPTITATTYDHPELLGHYPPARQLISTVISLESNIGTLISPVSITMKLSGTPVNPSAYYWDPATASWSTSGLTNVSLSANSLTFTTSHFSLFGIFDVSGIMSNILIYPNPFKFGSSAGVIFDGLKGNETIRLYNIAGETVSAQPVLGASTWIWDAKNSYGKQVARGIYLYLITNSSGEKRSGKIAVVN